MPKINLALPLSLGRYQHRVAIHRILVILTGRTWTCTFSSAKKKKKYAVQKKLGSTRTEFKFKLKTRLVISAITRKGMRYDYLVNNEPSK